LFKAEFKSMIRSCCATN